jgi:hypothetical protein
MAIIAGCKTHSWVAQTQGLLDCGLLNCDNLYVVLQAKTNVPEELAYIFRNPEDGRITLLRNVNIRLQDYTGVINQKITILVTTAVETSEPILGFLFLES